MKINIDKYKAKNELEKHLAKIEELKVSGYENDEFDSWLKSSANLIEDLFSKDSRQFKEFKKITFTPTILFLGNPLNDKYKENAYQEGLTLSKIYLEKLIKYITEYWNISPTTKNIRAIKPNIKDDNFEKLAISIKDSIENNEPELALDRLHTFLMKYFRELNSRHQLTFAEKTPLHSLCGSYVKYSNKEGKIDTKMTELILKSSISIMDLFNDIRNNKSFAHDNEILNYNESIFIFNSISNMINFINSVEEE